MVRTGPQSGMPTTHELTDSGECLFLSQKTYFKSIKLSDNAVDAILASK